MAINKKQTASAEKKPSSGYVAKAELHYGDELDSGVVQAGKDVPQGAFSEEDLDALQQRGHVARKTKSDESSDE